MDRDVMYSPLGQEPMDTTTERVAAYAARIDFYSLALNILVLFIIIPILFVAAVALTGVLWIQQEEIPQKIETTEHNFISLTDYLYQALCTSSDVHVQSPTAYQLFDATAPPTTIAVDAILAPRLASNASMPTFFPTAFSYQSGIGQTEAAFLAGFNTTLAPEQNISISNAMLAGGRASGITLYRDATEGLFAGACLKVGEMLTAPIYTNIFGRDPDATTCEQGIGRGWPAFVAEWAAGLRSVPDAAVTILFVDIDKSLTSDERAAAASTILLNPIFATSLAANRSLTSSTPIGSVNVGHPTTVLLTAAVIPEWSAIPYSINPSLVGRTLLGATYGRFGPVIDPYRAYGFNYIPGLNVPVEAYMIEVEAQLRTTGLMFWALPRIQARMTEWAAFVSSP